MNTPQDLTTPTPTPSLEAPSPSTSSIILACEMIDDEVRLVLERMAQQAGSFPLVWIESGLHDRPEKLRDHIQGLLDLLDAAALTGEPAVLPSVTPGRGPGADRSTEVTVSPVDDVLLALGYCGNGLQGLVSRTARLVFPRVDDCISLFLNHGCSRAEIKRDAHAFYLTKGWLAHNNALLDSHERMGGALRSREGPPPPQGEPGSLPALHAYRHRRLRRNHADAHRPGDWPTTSNSNRPWCRDRCNSWSGSSPGPGTRRSSWCPRAKLSPSFTSSDRTDDDGAGGGAGPPTPLPGRPSG